MSEKKPGSTTFHKMLVNGFLWVIAAAMIFIGIRNISYGIEDAVSPLALVIIMQAVLIISGLLLIKARFDLSKKKESGTRLMLIAFLAAAAAFFVDWRIYEVNGELTENSFLFPLLSACWGIVCYRYYRQLDEFFS